MSNENCLAGFKCPKCGYEDRFKIEARAMFTVTDEGTDFPEGCDWADESYCECCECAHYATVKDFQKGTDEVNQD